MSYFMVDTRSSASGYPQYAKLPQQEYQDFENRQGPFTFAQATPLGHQVNAMVAGTQTSSTAGNSPCWTLGEKHLPEFEPYQLPEPHPASILSNHHGYAYSNYGEEALRRPSGLPGCPSVPPAGPFPGMSSPTNGFQQGVLQSSIQDMPGGFSHAFGSPDPIDFEPLSSLSMETPVALRTTNTGQNAKYEDGNSSLTPTSEDQSSEDKRCDISYAKYIYCALMLAPGHRMVLKDIYRWIEQNTDKAKNPDFKGWQNSVRHNLSMNKAFTKIPCPPSRENSKKGYIWVLEQSQVGRGIHPTTRYRRKDDSKNSVKSDVASARQRSGRKGGRAAKRYARADIDDGPLTPPLTAQSSLRNDIFCGYNDSNAGVDAKHEILDLCHDAGLPPYQVSERVDRIP